MPNSLTLRANVVTDSSGDATVYLSRAGQSPYPLPPISGLWYVDSITYRKNDFASGVDFTITEYETARSLWTQSDVDASATHVDPVMLANGQIKIVVASGGASKTGTFLFRLIDEPPGELNVTAGVADGDYGDISVSGGGSVFTLDDGVVKTLTLIESPSVDATATGLKVYHTYGESLVPGDPVYMKSDGSVWKADANGSGTYPVYGIALDTASSGSHRVLLDGIMRLDAWTWTVGGVIYLSDSAGLTQTAPSTSSDIVQVVGIATHADRMRVQISPDVLTIA